ncbi:AraC family transcriptional regulator [Massilia sp. TN1-12]|uniref:AraC family transcriptional regulator n=1 Tax=Massilia paldalensis TaxID=3377675 RepID=UPI00384B0942
MIENPDAIDDLFSDLLELVRARSALSGGLRAGGRWAVAFPATSRVKFWGIRSGAAWIDLGDGAPLLAQAGDVFLFHAPGPHVLRTDGAGLPVALDTLAAGRRGAILQLGDGDDFFMIGGKVDLDEGSAPLLFGGLPPVLRLPAASPRAPGVHWILDRLVAEREAGLPGSGAASAQLAQLMLIEILRAHIAEPALLGSGYFKALADRRLAPALRLMHGEPGRAWRLPELAAACAMSRAGFADHFKRVAGASPLHYLTELRMRLARRRLRQGGVGLARLAGEYGYGSESAFSHAFKRVFGESPKAFRDGAAA